MSVRIKDLNTGTPSSTDYVPFDGSNGTKKIQWSDLPFYTKPASGIPSSDLTSGVQTSLGKADTALQSVPDIYRTSAAQDVIDATKESLSNKVTSLSASSTDTQYPSAKATYDELSSLKEELAALGLSVVDGKLSVTYAAS